MLHNSAQFPSSGQRRANIMPMTHRNFPAVCKGNVNLHSRWIPDHQRAPAPTSSSPLSTALNGSLTASARTPFFRARQRSRQGSVIPLLDDKASVAMTESANFEISDTISSAGLSRDIPITAVTGRSPTISGIASLSLLAPSGLWHVTKTRLSLQYLEPSRP